ncbi:DUF3137 domain-containing protein [Bogoriella caseilytica]|uniref:Uncharacterized protein DUF3137 n=1 Tax=Bogoriella caseilytica TaxID=56055 RepID=A0A3N2BC43_9MICO|nr:DUF3137 domain-containing protein [Bogoriella caseilytica]ROR72644.1 uncharacterized protein DUF3137 [Bogoriella caseilytica]
MEAGFFFIVIIAVVVGAIVWSILAHQKRRKEAQAWAAARQWRFTERSSSMHQGLRAGVFNTGSSRRASLILEGTFHNVPAASWNYQYTVSSGSGKSRSSTTYHFHVLELGLPEALPSLELSPDNAFRRFFGRGIEFEDDEFNRAWRVASDDERIAYDVIHPRMMERLMRPDLRGLSFLIQGNRLLIWRRGRQNLAAIDGGLATLVEFYRHIPDYLWQQIRERRSFGR